MGSALVTGLRDVEARGLLPGYKVEYILKDTWCKPNPGVVYCFIYTLMYVFMFLKC